jgi:hypothetical protein
MTSAMEKAREAWQPMPDWIEALALACDETTMNAVAARLDYSRTAVSLLVANKYERQLSRVERQVRAVLMRKAVACPVLGDIEMTECRRHQVAPYRPGSPTAVVLYRACHDDCPNSESNSQERKQA